MIVRVLRLSLIVGSFFVLAPGCARSVDEPPAVPPDLFVQPLSVSGRLESTVLDLYASPAVEKCDRDVRDRVLSLARDLDARQGFFSKAVVPGEIEIGGHVFTIDPERAAIPGWHRQSAAWRHLLAIHENMKRDPRTGDWAALEASVRSLLFDDTSRLKNLMHPNLGRTSQPLIRELLRKLVKCDETASCLLLALSAAEIKYLEQGWGHSGHWRKYLKAKNSLAAREPIRSLRSWVGRDWDWFQFKPNAKIRMSGSKLVLPLDLGPLRGSEADFERVFLAHWAWAGKSISIERARRSRDPGVYEIAIEKREAGRDHVSHSSRIVQLYGKPRVRTVAHEIGHVLGFPDAYFTTWDSRTCTYTSEQRGSDLMSNAYTGKITQDHWRSLSEAYR